MCGKERTKRGIDVPTVERMYRKYIDLDEKGKSEGCYVSAFSAESGK